MRGVVAVLVGILSLAAVLLVAGPLYEAIAPMVTTDPAVQAHGWGSIPGSIEHTVLAIAPRIALIGLVCIAIIYYLRKELLVTQRRP